MTVLWIVAAIVLPSWLMLLGLGAAASRPYPQQPRTRNDYEEAA